MRRFSLFEHIGYGDEFWDEAEDKPSGRPVCPTCNTDGLEKEERMDGRQDVWRCRNCKSRIADDNLNKAAGSDSTYFTLKFSEGEFGGLFDVLTLAKREQIANDEDINYLLDGLQTIYSGGTDEEGKYVLRINGDEWEIFRQIYETLAEYDGPDVERLKAENDDLSFKDIIDSEEVFMLTIAEPSSGANLEDIPTRNVGPEEERPGLFEGWEFETNPAPDKPEGGALGPSTPAAKAMAAGNCPSCGFPTTIDSTDRSKLRCSNCEWEGNQLPALSESSQRAIEQAKQKEKELEDLEQQFELPSVQHPLGPHTGSDLSNNQYYSIPIDTSGNEPLAVSIFLEWGDTYNIIPEGFMESDILSKDDQGNVIFSLTEDSHKTMFNLCQVFLGYAQQDFNKLIQSMAVLDTVTFVASQAGLDYTADPNGVNNMVVELIKEISNFIIKFSNTPPSPSSQANLEDAFNAPAVEHPLGPHTGNTQELYTSGSFVKGPDGRWLVVINPAGGQREPEPGDWATIQQRSKSFNRPVPLTLVEDMGGAWKFKNGHHPSIESQVEDETL